MRTLTGSTVWLVKKNVLVTMFHATSHDKSSSSMRMRISSGIASVGWVYPSQNTVSQVGTERHAITTDIVELDCHIWVETREYRTPFCASDDHAQSGNSVIGLPIFLKRRRISAKLAAVQKYCCFRRSSFPTSRNQCRTTRG